MRFLINCSNLKKGGGLQVADSVCTSLSTFTDHTFIVVLSSYLDMTAERILEYKNVRVVRHDIKNDWRTLILGRDAILDDLVKEESIDAVLTIFGPARWKPRRPHLCGFARAQLVLTDSPYYIRMAETQRKKERIKNKILKYFFRRGTTAFWTENPYISQKVESLFYGVRALTVTNYYNQVFDCPENQREHPLPTFSGCTLLSVNAPYPHKNLDITLDVVRYMRKAHPDFRFRFVLTLTAEDLPPISDGLKSYFLLIGRVGVDECPSLYRQADIMFQPSLLECFSATYCEAMRMERPIVTTDIEFARGLCGNSALYYSPLSAKDAAEAIYNVATDNALRMKLVKAGNTQLRIYDNYEQRAKKLINILGSLAPCKAI